MKGQKGIWIDGKKAMIVTIENDKPELEVLDSEVVYRLRIEGEGKAYTRFGDTFMTNETKDEERIRQERKLFLQTVAGRLDPDYDIVIAGPAMTKKELAKMLDEQQAYANKLITVKPLDSMTDNQFVAWVQEYFQQVAG
ncbi:MAG TPA: hypothetical protein VK907_08590 [Phnomibacter sp.]|nr:hypothetical protein [Phnomibacter sp.]